MKERPIIMSAGNIRAILSGRKTMTRRVVQPQPSIFANCIQGKPHPISARVWNAQIDEVWRDIRCPYGIPGDHLYVRETWRIMGLMYEDEPCIQYKADMAEQCCCLPDNWLDVKWEDWYERQSAKLVEDCERAGLKPNNDYDELYRWERDACPTRWQPSIHMPKFTSRIWLEVVSVRAERVQDITPDDIYAEGYPREMIARVDPLLWFRKLWDSLHVKTGYTWDKNNWVWVVSFQVVS